MQKYYKELIILIMQLLVFYITPLFMGDLFAMGVVLMIIILTTILSIVLGLISNQKIKYSYPIVIAILFIPSVFIFYNESALIHSIWYLIISIIGLIIGSFTKFVLKKLKR